MSPSCEKYRINRAVLGIESSERQRTPVTIPAGAWIVLIETTSEGSRKNVSWNGKLLTMWATDLLEHGIRWNDEPR